MFAALVDADDLLVWLPPEGMAGRFEHFDCRPGGSYRLELTYLDRSAAPGKTTEGSDVVEARFVAVVVDEEVVQAIDFVSDDPAFAGTMTMTWSVTAVDPGTRVDITAEVVPDGISERGPRRRDGLVAPQPREVSRRAARRRVTVATRSGVELRNSMIHWDFRLPAVG